MLYKSRCNTYAEIVWEKRNLP